MTDYRQALRQQLSALLDERLCLCEEAVEAYEQLMTLSSEKVALCEKRSELLIQLKDLDLEYQKIKERMELYRAVTEEADRHVKELGLEIREVKQAYRAES